MPRKHARSCPECAERFETTRLDQVFCKPACKAAFANRNSARGRGGLVQLALAWRNARNRREDAEVGRRAFQEMCQLLDAMAREDRASGRDPMAYLAQRWRAEGTMKPVSLSRPQATQTNPRRPARRAKSPRITTPRPVEPIALNQRVHGSSP